MRSPPANFIDRISRYRTAAGFHSGSRCCDRSRRYASNGCNIDHAELPQPETSARLVLPGRSRRVDRAVNLTSNGTLALVLLVQYPDLPVPRARPWPLKTAIIPSLRCSISQCRTAISLQTPMTTPPFAIESRMLNQTNGVHDIPVRDNGFTATSQEDGLVVDARSMPGNP
jgi:hypothetical protein